MLHYARLRTCDFTDYCDSIFPITQVEAYPRPLMRYTEELYRHAFGRYGDFRLRENGEVC